MPRPSKEFYEKEEKKLLALLRKYSARISRLYNKAIVEVSILGGGIKARQFKLDLYPTIRLRIDAILKDMEKEMLAVINSATREAWELSVKKNDIITRSILGKRTLPKSITDDMFNPNRAALEAFIKRRTGGLTLSRRVWRISKAFRHEIEAGLTDGINKGRSAVQMARDMKRYLRQPDKLFRRVRDENGKLQLSRAAKAYKPGRGVYRSSFKNALRVARTETNMAYRNADIARWGKLDFVLGYQINLSDNHVVYDICDPLAGAYPKDFNWNGWHPQCLCFLTPILVTQEEMDKMQDYLLGIGPEYKPKMITEMPAAFNDYVAENKDRIKGWKNPPYWVRDNPEKVKGLAG